MKTKMDTGYCKLSLDTAMTREEAMEDLEFVMAHLKKVHPMFYNNVPRHWKIDND